MSASARGTAGALPDLIRTFEAQPGQRGRFVSLAALEDAGFGSVRRLPVCLRIVLESLARNCDGRRVTAEHVRSLAAWRPAGAREQELPFVVSRVLLQDLSGLPVLNDLAAMREAASRRGQDPSRIRPQVPVDLVVDHAVSVDVHGRADALVRNIRLEYERNSERLRLLKWAQQAFDNLRVVPPGNGIVHQVNLERLSRGAALTDGLWSPETLVGTDSHTTMINGMGVLGWGVGGLEAFAALLGEPVSLLTPDVIGVHLTGALRPGVTATDLVLTVTRRLRDAGVVDKFVEYFGEGARGLSLADRATLANMAPDYGATCGFFAADDRTLSYLLSTGRDPQWIDSLARYLRVQGLFGTPEAGDCLYTDEIHIDLSQIGASAAGPRRPEQRLDLASLPANFDSLLADRELARGDAIADDAQPGLRHGDIAIAAITSCTNTSNPRLMLAAGLLAKRAVEAGLKVPVHVKTSLAPGSKVVGAYLRRAGLMESLDALGFQIVAHGCTTCMGNSGPLNPGVEDAIRARGIVACAVLSGNRNFEGRIHEAVQANYLMSPANVVAYALAGTVRTDIERSPLGLDAAANPIYLRDLMPAEADIDALMAWAADPAVFEAAYADPGPGQADWDAVPIVGGPRFRWPAGSTYLVNPPFFDMPDLRPADAGGIVGARALVVLGDSVTTDHITPNGRIRPETPAGQWLRDVCGLGSQELNTYAMRRCNHEVMMRGAFDHPGLRNRLAEPFAGALTRMEPGGEPLPIFDAAMKYAESGVPLVVIAGRGYGTGSSRDWAARAPALLGVRAVIAASFERIHRSNLVGMGILPCEFAEASDLPPLDLAGDESFDLIGLEDALRPRQALTLVVHKPGAIDRTFPLRLRVDTPLEASYVRSGGLLPYVLRRMTP